MPTYYFYLRDESAPPHLSGAVFHDASAAKQFARELSRALTDRAPRSKASWSVAVTDQNGSAVFEVPGRKRTH
jgi:hypothetical protein